MTNPHFRNYAGRDNIDELLSEELRQAGIEVYNLGDAYFECNRSEVKTRIVGGLINWQFKRAWRYWCAEGPGLPLQYANPLHEQHGQEARVAGHCGCPSPLEWYKGFGVGSYHVDTPVALRALADALRACAEDAKVEQP